MRGFRSRSEALRKAFCAFAEAKRLDHRLYDLKIDAAELRAKNLIRPGAFPYQTRTGWTYDTGNYAAAMAK